MTLAAFYALVQALVGKPRYKCAAAAQRLGDLMLRGMVPATAIANVMARKDLNDALLLAGLNDEFLTITGP